jgi:hypothetical protein
MARVLPKALALASVAGLAIAGTAASAQAGPGEVWRRVVAPDGSIAVSLPCPDSETGMRSDGGVTAMICKSEGLGFEVMVGAMPNGSGTPDSFDQLLSKAQHDPNAGEVHVTSVAGHRAFTVTRPASGPVGLAQFVDFKPGKPIIMMAMEDPEGGIDASGKAPATARARKFLGSLEMIG